MNIIRRKKITLSQRQLYQCFIFTLEYRSVKIGPYLYYVRRTDKKENKIVIIYKEIQMGSGAKSYMRKGILIYEEMHKYFHHIWGGR